MAVVVGIFALIVVVVLLVGRFRPGNPDALSPEQLPYPGGQPVPPTGAR